MKILLLDHPEFTHNTWYLYDGLVRILGRDCVTIFPSKPSFSKIERQESINLMDIRWYRDVYKTLDRLPRGIPPMAAGESLTNGDSRISFNALPHFFPTAIQSSSPSQQDIDEDELIELINDKHYDFIVLGNSHRVPTIALARLRDRCKCLPPIVYFDAGERDEMNAHWWHVFSPQLTFKAALTPEIFAQKGTPQVPCELFPMPLSHSQILIDDMTYQLNNDSFKNRNFDIVSAFGKTWPARLLVQDRVRDISYELSKTRKMNSLLDYYEQSQLSEAKVSVSMRGSGRDTERYWEMPARGSALICDGTMGCIHPFPFEENKHAMFYRNLDELESAIRILINDDDKRIEMAKNGHNHVRKFHSIEARTLYFLGIIKEKLGINYTDEQSKKLNNWYIKLDWSSSLPEWRGPVVGFKE